MSTVGESPASCQRSFVRNEQADQAAKGAAEAVTTDTTSSIRMKSAQYQSIQSMANNNWTTGRQNARLRNMSQHPDVTTGPKLYDGLQQRKHMMSRSKESMWVWSTRLCTGRCHLTDLISLRHNANVEQKKKLRNIIY